MVIRILLNFSSQLRDFDKNFYFIGERKWYSIFYRFKLFVWHNFCHLWKISSLFSGYFTIRYCKVSNRYQNWEQKTLLCLRILFLQNFSFDDVILTKKSILQIIHVYGLKKAILVFILSFIFSIIILLMCFIISVTNVIIIHHSFLWVTSFSKRKASGFQVYPITSIYL